LVFGTPVCLPNLHVTFLCQGDWIKVRVTRAVKCAWVTSLWVVGLRLTGSLVIKAELHVMITQVWSMSAAFCGRTRNLRPEIQKILWQTYEKL